MKSNDFGWFSIVRLGLVQAALGAVVVLTTSTINRVMVVEIGLAAMIPGALVTLHYLMQLLRPRMGHGSDLGQRRTPWIIGGMFVLALGGIGAATATALMSSSFIPGLALAIISFLAIGAGVSAAGTSLLVLLAKRVSAERRPAAATVVWMMMIAGFAITATLAGKFLEPFSGLRLIAVTASVSAAAFAIAISAIWGVEGDAKNSAASGAAPEGVATERRSFVIALREAWADRDARHFTIFVFVSMLAYSAQDLILEPFAGSIFGFTPGESTKLSGVQHGGVFIGMLLVAVVGTIFKGKAIASPKRWIVGGCIASALALAGLVAAGFVGAAGGTWPVRENVFLLGLANGAFSIAAIAAMMSMASQGVQGREGVRMGLWGASQAIAFGGGGMLGTILCDAARYIGAGPAGAYSIVFALESIAFVVAAMIAMGIAVDRAQGKADVLKDSPDKAGPLMTTRQTRGHNPALAQSGD
ncbi:MAG: BCD family MFS transporter [Burkholderiales bacterium]|jgi:BCD family chlorophyll transporter-like MFS transporter